MANKPGSGPPGPPGAPPPKPPVKPGGPTAASQLRSPRFWITLLIVFGLNIFVANVLFAPQPPKSVTIPYNVFKEQITAGNVVSITSTGTVITGTTKTAIGATLKASDKANHFSTVLPAFADPGLESLLEQNNVTINVNDPNQQ